jgi:hypothetical protein
MRNYFAALIIVAVLGGPQASAEESAAQQTTEPAANEAYEPSLGDIMARQQMRHIKLWFAGDAGNWKLAAYELGELRDGFDEIVQFHKTHKESPVPIDDAIETIVKEPLSELAKAIEKKDRTEFRKTFDAVTDACNACHQATNYDALVIVRPKANPYSNQVFAQQK